MPGHPEEIIATVSALWRYPVKSMMGEELAAVDLTGRGLIGDRQYALIESETGKIASAKNPRKWAKLFDCRATFLERPSTATPAPRIRITLPDGVSVTSDQADAGAQLSRIFGRDVRLSAGPPSNPTFEEYWPAVEGLPHADVVTDEAMPPSMFFDSAPLHLITNSTLDRLQTLYPRGRFDPRRFRPNILVALPAHVPAFVENEWVGRMISIGEQIQLNITALCPRCVMTTLAQEDLPQDLGILQTAVKENQGAVGVYAQVVRGGIIRRRDAIRFASV